MEKTEEKHRRVKNARGGVCTKKLKHVWRKEVIKSFENEEGLEVNA